MEKHTPTILVVGTFIGFGLAGLIIAGNIYSLAIYGLAVTKDLWIRGGHTSWVHELVSLLGFVLCGYIGAMYVAHKLVKRGRMTVNEMNTLRLRNWLKL